MAEDYKKMFPVSWQELHRDAKALAWKLVAGGRLSELLAFELKGWELVAGRVSADALAVLQAASSQVPALGHDRYSAELRPAPPEAVLSALTAAGAQVLSLNPIRDTLESFFVQHVAATAARDTIPQ